MQALCTSWAQVLIFSAQLRNVMFKAEAFVIALNPQPFQIVIKPAESAATDGVFLCSSMEQVKV